MVKLGTTHHQPLKMRSEVYAEWETTHHSPFTSH